MTKRIITISLLALFLAFPASAAFMFLPDRAGLSQGEEFRVDLVLDSEGQPVNAISGRLSFDTTRLKLKEVVEGSSLINFWIERPQAGGPTSLSGIIPGGWEGKRGEILSLFFEALTTGDASISLDDISVLASDGQGTLLRMSAPQLVMPIKEREPGESFIQPKLVDGDAPENFKIYLARDPEIFSGRWFISFVAQDKASGISGYMVREDDLITGKAGTWQDAQSPYVLKDQSLSSVVYVKATDRAGHERIATLEAPDPEKIFKKLRARVIIKEALLIILGAAILVLALKAMRIWRKR